MVKVRRIATLQPAKPIAHITPSRAATINALQKLGMPDNKPGRLQSGKRRSSRVPLQRVPFVPATGPAYIRNAKATPKPKKIATKATKVNKASALKPKVARKAAGKRAKPTDEETEASDNEDGNAKPKAKKKRVEKAKKEKGEKKDKKEKKEKVVKEKKTRNKNDKLVPRPNVTQYDKDPTFELKEQIPFVSVSAYSKLAIRAVLTKNEGLLKRLIDDKDHCASILLERSKFVPKSAISYAIRAEDSKMIDLIKQGQEKIEKEGSTRVRMEKNLLQSMNTGRANYRMLGHATRAIQMTRGAKEGNNAFVLYEPEHDEANHYLGDMLEDNISFDFIQTLVAKQYVNSHQLQSNIYKAVRMGHRKLAGKLIETYATHYFNELHIQALLNDKQALKKFMPISVKKKGRENKDFTPIHAACINPNDAYLKDMIAVESDFNHADADGWRSIHYAAVCEGTKPLQLLLSKGASVYDITKQHDTPLHAAARAGRQHNVALLAKIISDDDKQLRVPEDEDEEGDENATAAQKKAKAKKTPASKVNQKNRGGLTALHLAVNFGHVECVKTLIQFGANVEETAGGAASKVTPLMIACQQGDLPLVKYLIEQAHAVVNSKDKLKRTPLTHAVISGQGHVTSYLLRLGADPNMADSSENTPAHYAAAYGWYFCLKLLGEAGASMNAANAWQLTPLAVAYLKGHMGLADFLLEGNWQDPVDINCKDNDGLTLVSTVASNGANEQTLGQLTYLITKKHADCSITDTMGNTPLHHLAAASVTFLNGTETTAQEKEYKISVKDYLAIAALLIQGGADPSKKNEMGNTALQLVIEQFNLPLAEFLFAKGGSLADVEMAQPSDVNQRTILHDLLTLPLNVYSLKDKWSGKYGPAQEQIKVVSLFNKLASLDPERVRVMLKQMDKNGLTPMLLACKQCSAFNTHQFAQDNYSVAERKLIIEGAEKALQAVIEVIEAVEAILPGAVVQQVGEDKSDIMGKKSDEDEEDMEDSDEEDEDEDKDDEDSLSEHDEGDDATEEKREKKKKEKSQSARATHAHADQGRCSFHFAVLSQTPSKESNGAAESAATYSPDSVKLVGGLLRAAKRSKKLADALIIRDAAGFTPLLTALHHHKMNAAISIIRASQEEGCGSAVQSACITEDGTEKEPPSKKTALMMAIENKMLGAIKEFRLSPAEMNAVDKDGNNALHYAARQLQMHTATVMEILVKGGAQFTLNKWKRSPLHIAVNADDGAADGTTEPIEWLIENGGDKNNTNGRIYEKDIRGRLPLHYAFVKIARHTDVSKIDPISVVSVLIRAMDKKFLDTKDEFGCTPLHYAAMRGANICIVTLLQHGSDPNILTIHGNSSLGFATLHGHEPSALTLLQARSSIAPMITSGKLESVQDYDKKNKWIWTPNKPEMRKEVKAPIASIVVKNGWQGIIYIILDLLTKNLSTVTQLVSAAVEHRKYNLALSLLRMLRPLIGQTPIEREKNLRWLNEQMVFAKFAQHSAVVTEQVEVQKKVIDELLQDGVGWFEKQKDGTFKSDTLTWLLENRDFVILDYLSGRDTAETRKNWTAFNKTSGLNPIASIFCKPVQGLVENEDARRWLKIFAGSHDVNALSEYDQPADPTDPQAQRRMPQPLKKRSTPLIRAIQARNFELVKFVVLELKADVNIVDEEGVSPLMHACLVNSDSIVRFLMDLSSTEESEKSQPTVKVTKSRATRVFGQSIMPTSQLSDASNVEDVPEDDEDGDEDDEDGEEDDDEEMDDDEEWNEDEVAPPKRGRKASRKALNPKKPKKTTAAAQKSNQKGGKWKFTNTKLRVSLQDKNQRNFYHYMIAPCGWENTQLMEAVYGALGSNQKQLLLQKDKDGRTPAQLAKFLHQGRMAAAIMKLTKEADSLTTYGEVVVDLPADSKRDIDQDSAKFIEADTNRKKQAQPKKVNEMLIPHKLSSYREMGEIVVCAATQQPYNALLNKTDVNYGQFGFYNFYRLQLIRRKGSDLYVLFTHWGRIGDEGQYQRTPFGKLEDAEKEFRSVFRSKTGNDWSKGLSSFEAQPKKYHLIKQDVEGGSENLAELSIDFSGADATKKKAGLIDEVYTFIKDVSNVKRLQQRTRAVCSYSNLDRPFGRLQRGVILKAKTILEEIGVAIHDHGVVKKESNFNADKALGLMKRMAELSNEFYQTLPFGGFHHAQLPVIESEEMYRDFSKVVENLLEFEIAGKLLAGAAYSQPTVNPMRYIYDALECRLRPADPNADMVQHILHYMKNSSSARVKCVYEFASPRQEKSFVGHKLSNHKYLWHGTKPENLLSILKVGLLVAPSNALRTGQLYGNGIYTSDQFAKSEMYCTSSADGMNYALLCQVALGECESGASLDFIFNQQDRKSKLKFDSLHISSTTEPDPKFNLTLDTGAVLPIGPIVNVPKDRKTHNGWYVWSPHSEFIVYKPEQIAIRYVIAFRSGAE